MLFPTGPGSSGCSIFSVATGGKSRSKRGILVNSVAEGMPFIHDGGEWCGKQGSKYSSHVDVDCIISRNVESRADRNQSPKKIPKLYQANPIFVLGMDGLIAGR